MLVADNNVAVQICNGPQTVVIPTSDSTNTLPSVVSIGKEVEIDVGAAAKRFVAIHMWSTCFSCVRSLHRTCLLTLPMACRLSAAQPSTTYYSVKRFMGRQLEDTKQLARSVSGLLLQDPGSWQLHL